MPVMGQYPTDDQGGFGTQEPSMWSQLAQGIGDNGDIIATLAGKYAQYENQKANNQVQDKLNQVAAKWSGFNPNLLSAIKPTETPNPLSLVAEAIKEGPLVGYDLNKLYEARKASKAGDASKMEDYAKKDEGKKLLNNQSIWYGLGR